MKTKTTFPISEQENHSLTDVTPTRNVIQADHKVGTWGLASFPYLVVELAASFLTGRAKASTAGIQES